MGGPDFGPGRSGQLTDTKQSQEPPELAEHRKLMAGTRVSAEEAKDLSYAVFNTIEGWQDRSRIEEGLVDSVKADLGKIATTSYESPGEEDPYFGDIGRLPNRPEADRKPEPPKRPAM